MKKPEILILGGTGLLGSRVYRQLRERGTSAIPASCDAEGGYLAGEELKDLVCLDLERPLEILEFVKEYGIDRVLLFAAVIDTTPSAMPGANEKLLKVNLDATLRTLEVLCGQNVKLIFSSSMTVYSPDAGLPAKEDALKAPRHPYGLYKKWIEEAIEYMASNGGLKAVTLRFPGLFAPERKQGLVYNAAKKMVHGEDLELQGGDLGFWEGMHARDAAEAVVKILEGHDWSRTYDVFNVGYGKEADIMKTIDLVREMCSSPAEVRVAAPFIYKKFFMDTSKFVSRFGPFENDIRSAVEALVGEIRCVS